jgi:Protein of unknown function (DUF1629)
VGKKASRSAPNTGVRRFFQIGPDWRLLRAAGFALENEAKLLQGRPILGPDPGKRGFPPYPEMPRIVIDRKLGRAPTDFEEYSEYWLVSDRLKRVLEAVDTDGCAFLECDVRHAQGTSEQDYWLFDVIRILDAVDETASRLTIVRDQRACGGRYYRFSGGANIVFKPEAIGSAHIFGLSFARSAMFCDDELRLACKRAGVKGIEFRDATDL